MNKCKFCGSTVYAKTTFQRGYLVGIEIRCLGGCQMDDNDPNDNGAVKLFDVKFLEFLALEEYNHG